MPAKLTIIINRSMGELEWITPVFIRLVEQGSRVDLVFLRQRELNYFLESKLLLNSAQQYADNIQLYYRPAGLADRIGFKWNRLKSKLLIKKASRGYKDYSLVRLDQFSYKTDMLFFDNSFYRDLNNDKSVAHQLLPKFDTTACLIFPHAPIIDIDYQQEDRDIQQYQSIKDNHFMQEVDYWRAFPQYAHKTGSISDSLVQAGIYSNNRGLSTIYVKSPRYQTEWLSRFEKQGHSVKKVLILSKLQGVLFRSFTHIKPIELIGDLIEICEEKGLSWQIKAHPRDDMQALINKVESLVGNRKGVFFQGSVVDDPEKASLCLSLPTSAVLDTITAGIPTVEYFPDTVDKNGKEYHSAYIQANLVVPCSSKQDIREVCDQVFEQETSQNLVNEQQLNLAACLDSAVDPVDAVKQIYAFYHAKAEHA